MNYLDALDQTLRLLPPLLRPATPEENVWDSLIVNRRKPATYRVFTKLPNGLRVCLHKFDPCHTHEAFSHPHPWEGAFIVLRGCYKMQVGVAPDRERKPEQTALTLVLPKWSRYEIVNPLTFHSVIPLEPTWTVMINGDPWPPEVAHTEVRRTGGKDLDKMPDQDLWDHLGVFRILVADYLTTLGNRP